MQDTEISERLKAIERTLNRIETSLSGDEEFGHVGLFHRVAHAERVISDHSNLVLSVKAKMLGALTASTLIGGFLNWLLGFHFTPDK
jgi:hypothetical protein